MVNIMNIQMTAQKENLLKMIIYVYVHKNQFCHVPIIRIFIKKNLLN